VLFKNSDESDQCGSADSLIFRVLSLPDSLHRVLRLCHGVHVDVGRGKKDLTNAGTRHMPRLG